jgi:rod shape determining protein RodA
MIIMLQPDLGTGIVFIGIFFAMLYWAGVAWPLLILIASPAISLILSFSVGLWGAWFFILLALVLWYRPYLIEGIVLMVLNVATGVIAPMMWEKLAPYQQNRLKVFIDPSADPRASGYHVIQSKVAIGSGGFFGKGFTMGTQKRLAFLPEQHTDFIFSVVGEELGFLGVTVALALFLWLFLRITQVAERANDSFSSLVAFGLMSSWFVHVLVNVGMTLNLMPITGIPLPFFSYGGSFMLASWLAVGILMRISGEGRGSALSLRR